MLTITSNLVTISNCDVDDWDGGIGTLDTDFKKEGVGCLGIDTDIETNRAYKTIAEADWTGRHLYVWLMVMTATLDTKFNGGLQLILVDKNGNEGYWHVGGSDTYSGGWKRFVISADSAPDSNNGANPDKTVITKVGVGFKCIAKSKLAQNSFWDYVQYDTAASRGMKVTGGVETLRNWDELLAKDEAATIGMIRKEGGVFYLQGTFQFGDSAAGDIEFEDINQLLVFEDIACSADFHKILVVGNAGGTTSFKLGSKSGSAGIQGCVLKSVGDTKFQIDAIDTDIDNLGLYGCTFLNAGVIALPSYSTSRECLSCNFGGCAEILPNNCIFEYCTVVNATQNGLLMEMVAHRVKYCNFINCPRCIHVNFSDEVDFIDLVFTGSNGTDKYDVVHSVAGTLTINNKGVTNTQYTLETGGGNTNIVSPVTLTLKGLPSNTEVTIVKVSDRTVLYHIENSDGDVVYNYGSAEIGLVVDILSMHLDYDPNLGQMFDYTLGSEDVAIPISLVLDPTYYNP